MSSMDDQVTHSKELAMAAIMEYENTYREVRDVSCMEVEGAEGSRQ